MDKHFLEFWGNFMLNAARGQKQLDDINKWMGQDLSGFEDLTGMFKKFYGLDRLSEDSGDYLESWKQATEEFQKSFKDYLILMNVVPKDEHLALVKKYEALKKKVADQEETIEHLRMLLGEKGADQGETVKVIEDFMKKQTEQFQKLIKSSGDFLKESTQAPKEKK